MKTSVHGVKLIEAREGIRYTVYLDSKGIPTVGVGHVVLPADNLKLHDKITPEQCDAFLEHDLGKCEAAVNAVGVVLTQWQFDALVSLCFNIGTGDGGFLTSTVRRDLLKRDYKGAAEAFLLWRKPPEIIGRRRTEYNQFLVPDYFYTSSAAASTEQNVATPAAGGDPADLPAGESPTPPEQPPIHQEAEGQ